MSGKDERKGSDWVVRRCACGQAYFILANDEQTICHSCKMVIQPDSLLERQAQELREEAHRRFPYLLIPHGISPIDREWLERGSLELIRKYKKLWSRRTETGSMDVLLVDAAQRVFRYIHIGPTGTVDWDEEVDPMIQIVPYTVLELGEHQVTNLEAAADRIRLERVERVMNRNGT